MGTDRSGGFENCRSVGLLCPYVGASCSALRKGRESANLLSFNNHIPIVSRDTSTLEPILPPQVCQERRNKREMSWPLDWPRPKAERFSGTVVMYRLMPLVNLLGKHLPRLT